MVNWLDNTALLAEDDNGGGAFRFIVFAIMAIVWIVGALVKKASEKAVQERAERRRREMASELSHEGESAGKDEGWVVVEPQSPPRPLAITPEPPPLRPEPHLVNLQPIKEMVHPPLPGDIGRKTLGKLIRKRSGAPPPPRLQPIGLVSPTAAPPSPSRPTGVRVQLTDRATARAAIIMHEILSPPKSLRDEPEMWDSV